MLAPILFQNNFDWLDRFAQNPWFDFNDREFKNLEKKVYGHRAGNIMNTDIKETDSEYEMMIDLPGFTKDEIKVALENGYLTISAAKTLERDEQENGETEKKGRYIRKERYSGTCTRSFYIGEGPKTEDIKAGFKHGILTLNIPKKDQKLLEDNKYITIEG